MRHRVASIALALGIASCAPASSAPGTTSGAPSEPSGSVTAAALAPPRTPEPVACPVPLPEAPPAVDSAARPAVAATLELFEGADVVAIGEYHGWTAQHDFFAQLVCDPGFPAVADAVVIEFGNRRLQSIIDRYVAGQVVSSVELASVWRESTQRSGVFDDPVYERFLGLIRSVNEGLSAADHVQVLAGDPPIDYGTVELSTDCSSEDPACYDYWIQQREESYAGVVIDDVLDHGRSALLIAGAGHMMRRPDDDGRPPSIPDRIEAEWPGASRVVIPHRSFGSADATSDGRIRSWPVPSLALLDGSWIGALDACLLEGDAAGAPDAPSCPDGAGLTLADIADAYLYVGSS